MEIDTFITIFRKINIMRIGWFKNQWGDPQKLALPICDRGLNLGDGLFETVQILNGKPQLLNEHIERLQRSSLILGLPTPPTFMEVQKLLNENPLEIVSSKKDAILRLNWSRGNSLFRGTKISSVEKESPKPNFWIEINIAKPSFSIINTTISKNEYRNEKSSLSSCKTLSYTQSIKAKIDANLYGYDDAILLNTSGKLCCGSTSNILIYRKNKWLTPAKESGCLPGIMRQQGISKRIIYEENLSPDPMTDDYWMLINSVGCHPIRKINNLKLKVFPEAYKFWKSLI